MTFFGGRVFGDDQVNMWSSSWALIQDSCPYKKQRFGHRVRCAQRGNDVKRYSETGIRVDGCTPSSQRHTQSRQGEPRPLRISLPMDSRGWLRSASPFPIGFLHCHPGRAAHTFVSDAWLLFPPSPAPSPPRPHPVHPCPAAGTAYRIFVPWNQARRPRQ